MFAPWMCKQNPGGGRRGGRGGVGGGTAGQGLEAAHHQHHKGQVALPLRILAFDALPCSLCLGLGLLSVLALNDVLRPLYPPRHLEVHDYADKCQPVLICPGLVVYVLVMGTRRVLALSPHNPVVEPTPANGPGADSSWFTRSKCHFCLQGGRAKTMAMQLFPRPPGQRNQLACPPIFQSTPKGNLA